MNTDFVKIFHIHIGHIPGNGVQGQEMCICSTFLTGIQCSFSHRSSKHIWVGLLLSSLFSSICLAVYPFTNIIFNYYDLTIGPHICYTKSSSLVLLIQNCIAYIWPFEFPLKILKSDCQFSQK